MTEFSMRDIAQIKAHDLTLDVVQNQLACFKTGFPPSDIVAPALRGSGITVLAPDELNEYADYWQQNKSKYKIVKFVPASGAATRMFNHLIEFLNTGVMNNETRRTLDNIERFAFYDALREQLPPNATPQEIIEKLVSPTGLNYGNLPKALLAFHKYADGVRTAIAEHLVEGAQYAAADGIVNLHFTVSPEHMAAVRELLNKIMPVYGTRYNVQYNVSLSVQKPSTDTVAVNPDNSLFRCDNGTLLFRPAGHGALIENLNDIDADFIFIKNVDNICTDSYRADTILYKRALGGVLVRAKNKVTEYIRQIDRNTANADDVRRFIESELGIHMHQNPTMAQMRAILDRPLRVCGIIKNTGAPGGGPFWVRGARGTSLQIVEPGQIAPENISILKDGEWFSPTDIVCAVRDYNDKKYNLIEHIDQTAGFIVNKTHAGRPLRAMERPGLWNGAMADWNTIFVATPNTTFTPVKSVCDLLGAGHIDE